MMQEEARLPSDRWPLTRLVWLGVFAAAVGQPFATTSGCNGKTEMRLADQHEQLLFLAFMLGATVLLPLITSLFRGSLILRKVALALGIYTGFIGAFFVLVMGYVSIVSRTTPQEGAHLSLLAMAGATLENIARAIANRLARTRSSLPADRAISEETKTFLPWYRRARRG